MIVKLAVVVEKGRLSSVLQESGLYKWCVVLGEGRYCGLEREIKASPPTDAEKILEVFGLFTIGCKSIDIQRGAPHQAFNYYALQHSQTQEMHMPAKKAENPVVVIIITI